MKFSIRVKPCVSRYGELSRYSRSHRGDPAGLPEPPRVIGGAAACAVVGWLSPRALDDIEQFVIVTLNGLTLAALYFVVASGFTLIFGLMRVVNMAHGSLYLLGGYLAFEMQKSWFTEESEGLNLSLGSPTGSATRVRPGRLARPGGARGDRHRRVGVLIQQVFLRWNQGEDLRQALITIAISVILADQMLAHFGGIAKDIKPPSNWPESVTIFGVQYGFFRLVIVTGAALVIGLGPVVAHQAHALRPDRARRRGRPRDGLRARDQHPDRLRRRLLHRRDAGRHRRRPRRHDDRARARRGRVVPAELADRGDHRRHGQPRRRGDRRAPLLGLVDAYADVYLVFGDTDLTNYSILLTFALLVAVLAVPPAGPVRETGLSAPPARGIDPIVGAVVAVAACWRCSRR